MEVEVYPTHGIQAFIYTIAAVLSCQFCGGCTGMCLNLARNQSQKILEHVRLLPSVFYQHLPCYLLLSCIMQLHAALAGQRDLDAALRPLLVLVTEAKKSQ